jgi:hypothetical protein
MLLVKGDLWTTWSQDTSTIPSYILDVLNHPKSRTDKRHTIEEMELSEETFRDGIDFVVDENETDGASVPPATSPFWGRRIHIICLHTAPR